MDTSNTSARQLPGIRPARRERIRSVDRRISLDLRGVSLAFLRELSAEGSADEFATPGSWFTAATPAGRPMNGGPLTPAPTP